MATQLVQHDTLDDRRELHRLLSLLSPSRRVAFVESCCQRAVLPHSQVRPGVARRTHDLAELARRDSSADERLTFDLYFDLWHLSANYTFDLADALARLEQVVSRAR